VRRRQRAARPDALTLWAGVGSSSSLPPGPGGTVT
jgi:hypothetical protein